MIKEDNMNDIYYQLVKNVLDNGENVNGTKELQNVNFELTNPLKNITQNRSDSKYGLSLEYALGELVWYLSGSNSMYFISKFGKMWEKLSDDGVTNNSAYGYKIQKQFGFNQINVIKNLLTRDPNSRRAVININIPNKNVFETNDEPCTIALQFLIRNNKLNLTTIMRSNDLWFGTPYDVLFFTTVQQLLADSLDIELGTYHHFATSMHIYDRNIDNLVLVSKEKYDNHLMINSKELNDNAQKIYDKIYPIDREQSRVSIIELAKENGII